MAQDRVITSDIILPYIETDQYIDFVDTCEYVRKYHRMALIFGHAGAGKTAAARRYRAEQPVMTANGQSPVLYFQLTRSDTNHRSFNNRVVEAITGVPNQNRSSAVALAEAKRLLKKYGYELLIVDEVGFLDESGLEAARTLHDETEGLPIVFITMPDKYKRIEAEERFDTFHSRLADVREFGLLTLEHIKIIVLPNLSSASHLQFDRAHVDADKIAAELFAGCGGSEVRGARFREVGQILERCNDLIQDCIEIRERLAKELPGEQIPARKTFNVELIREAIRRSKRRSVQRASNQQPATTNQVPPKTEGKGSTKAKQIDINTEEPMPPKTRGKGSTKAKQIDINTEEPMPLEKSLTTSETTPTSNSG